MVPDNGLPLGDEIRRVAVHVYPDAPAQMRLAALADRADAVATELEEAREQAEANNRTASDWRRRWDDEVHERKRIQTALDEARGDLAAQEGITQRMADLFRWPECHEAVAPDQGEEDGEEQPCNGVAVAWRVEPDVQEVYPVCVEHMREPMASLAQLRAALGDASGPAEVLVEGSQFPVADLPRILGNFMRSSADYARQAKEAHVRIERLRILADGWEKTAAEHRAGANSAWPSLNARRDLAANALEQMTAEMRAELAGGAEATEVRRATGGPVSPGTPLVGTDGTECFVPFQREHLHEWIESTSRDGGGKPRTSSTVDGCDEERA